MLGAAPAPGQVRIETSGWSYDHSKDVLYPPGAYAKFRHSSWDDEAVYRILERHGASSFRRERAEWPRATGEVTPLDFVTGARRRATRRTRYRPPPGTP
ncbi:hypothetical protein GCM10009816_03300 [Microbacterium aquimaris]